MNMNNRHQTGTVNRRRFFHTSLLGSTALAAAASVPGTLLAGVAKPTRDPYDGLKVGMASYTLNKFDLDHAIAMTKQVGIKYICLKDVHLAMKSTDEQIQEARRKLDAAGLLLVGGGVIYMKNEAEVQNSFEYAKKAGMPTIVCSPDVEVLDLVERRDAHGERP
jgi:hypothetical protein